MTGYPNIQIYQPPSDPYSIAVVRQVEPPPADGNKLIYSNPLASHVIHTIYRRAQTPCVDSTDNMFEDRLSLIRSKLELILLQLAERKKINRKILYQIDQDGCYIQNLYFELGPKAYGLSSEKLTLNKMNLDLERQRRTEQTAYFNDTANLNRDLKDTLVQYMDEVQKNKMLTEEEDPL